MIMLQNQDISKQMNNQPILNIGCLGSVSDGKSTTVLQLTGIKTQKDSREQTRNITIKQGYANMKIWKDSTGKYSTTNSSEKKEDCELAHHISFVDCPGHQTLILTMLSSVSLMKGALVVVSAAEDIRTKPQLIQHLAAAKIAGLTKLIIIFNKLDLVTKEVALERYEQLNALLAELEIVPSYIIPTALSRKIGLQNVINAIMELFPPTSTVVDEDTEFKITRSFDINKPGINWDAVKGGIIGGGLITGKLKVGDAIEIRPGLISKTTASPIITTVLSMETDKIPLDNIRPGGLIGIATNVDPFYTKDDKLAGQIVGLKGTLPSIYTEIKLEPTLTTIFGGNWTPQVKDKMFLQIGNVNTESELINITKSKFTFKLSKPCCIKNDSLIIICQPSDNDALKIVGYGKLDKKSTPFLE
jgi:translation initiation factor 2 subunit 3